MKIDEYAYIEEKIEDGLQYAIRRAFKHRDESAITEEELIDQVDDMTSTIMTVLSESIQFEGTLL